MKISGGTTFGNWATGRPLIVTRPTMTMMMEITIATIGRLIKNRDMPSVGRLRSRRGQCHRHVIGGAHGDSVLDLLQAFRHDALAGAEPVLDQPKLAEARARPHGLDMDMVFRIHQCHLELPL